MLQFEKTEKYYGNHLALSVPALELPEGLHWLQGENGSGKTTLLKMIAGLHPFKGDILRDGISIKKQRNKFLSAVNYGEAEPLYPSFLTAKDLLELYCYTKNATITDSMDLLSELHIKDAYYKPVGTYSSGMVKKLSLVLAFVGNPKLILLDEPLITIDVASVDLICNLIKKKRDREGVSFIISSHQSFETAIHFTSTVLVKHQTLQIKEL